MFYNRKKELEYLDAKFNDNGAQLLIFWGRRRIGKSFLLREFCTKRRGVFLLATTTSSMDNLDNFSLELANHFNDERLQAHSLKSWDELFLYLDEKIQRRTVVVIDEYPYLVENKSGISSVLQKYWDTKLQHNANVMLILNGSAISMMEREALDYKSPLYGRRTGQWFLEAFDVISANYFFQYNSLAKAIESYVITGGVPYYCTLLNQNTDIYSIIEQKILSRGEALFEEVDFLLRQEFRTPRSYFPILKAIALGAHKFGELSSKTGYDKSNLTKYISSLERLGLIRKETPISETQPAKSRKTLYFINDNFMNFWFSFVFPHKSDLEFGETNKIMKNFVKPHFDYYVSQNVEPVIINLLKQDFFKLGFKFDKIGRYWDKTIEIDILGETDAKTTVVGEIKWQKTVCHKSVFFSLTDKANSLGIKNPVVILFSKSGFAKDLLALKNNRVILIDLRHYELKA